MKDKIFIWALIGFLIFSVVSILLTDFYGKPAFVKDKKFGYEYKLVTVKSKEKAKKGQVVVGYFTFYNDRDSIFFTTYSTQEKTLTAAINDSYDSRPLSRLGIGDSGLFKMATDSFFKGGNSVPSFIKKHSYLIIGVRVDTIIERTDLMSYFMKQQKKVEEEEDKQINDYMLSKGITASKTASGLYYSITKEGTGDEVKDGDEVSVLYKGKFLDDKVFDSSEMHGNEPFSFVIGKRSVIKGWNEGLTFFNKGAKGILLIPSSLGYGMQGFGDRIPPNTALIFEIEVTDIKK